MTIQKVKTFRSSDDLADLIQKEIYDGWQVHSMQSMSLLNSHVNILLVVVFQRLV